MAKILTSCRQLAAIAGIALLAACASREAQQTKLESAPPPPSSHPSLYQVSFATNGYSIDSFGHQAIQDVGNRVVGNKTAFVTIVGRTDTAGSPEYNNQLSHRRAIAVRDALISTGNIDTGQIETAWTGTAWTGHEGQTVATFDGAAEARNRVVDLIIH